MKGITKAAKQANGRSQACATCHKRATERKQVST